MLAEVADLSAGAVTIFMPLFVLTVPGILLVLVPVIAAGVILAFAGALLALPLVPAYLLLRAIRGAGRRT